MTETLDRRWGCALLGTVLVCGFGCGGSGPVPVTGKVTVDGVPVAGAGVLFTPKGGGRPAHGETKADGTYELTTARPGDGALPGEYVVTIVWDEPVHPYLAFRDGAPEKAKHYEDYLKWKANRKEQPSPVPAVYGDPAKTPLRQEVPAPGGVANFDLKSGAK